MKKCIYKSYDDLPLMLNTGLRTGELLGHSTSQITELYNVKNDTAPQWDNGGIRDVSAVRI
ncbi:MAG: hypothetical protein HFE78_08340 [Clostridiales bacterium]|nr:hypothetical protein [Clostridiales bacterium]